MSQYLILEEEATGIPGVATAVERVHRQARRVATPVPGRAATFGRLATLASLAPLSALAALAALARLAALAHSHGRRGILAPQHAREVAGVLERPVRRHHGDGVAPSGIEQFLVG